MSEWKNSKGEPVAIEAVTWVTEGMKIYVPKRGDEKAYAAGIVMIATGDAARVLTQLGSHWYRLQDCVKPSRSNS